MARLGDLGRELSVVGPLFFLGIVSAEGDHAPRETGQVPHLVVQNPPSPLSNVGQPPGRDIQQVGLYCLGARWESGGRGGRAWEGTEKGREGRKVSAMETAAMQLCRALQSRHRRPADLPPLGEVPEGVGGRLCRSPS